MPEIKTLLIIDDDIDDQEILMAALEQVDSEITCVTAFNGKEALDKLTLTSAHPELIFLDLNMPGMNGTQFLRVMKTNPHLKHIPVIVFSTSSNPADIKLTRELGAEKFITKPTSFVELKRIVKSIVVGDVS